MKIRSILIIYIPCLILTSTFGIWFFEYVLTGNPNSSFDNIFNCFWWTIQTISFISYGDLKPITIAGQTLSSLIIFASIIQTALIFAYVSEKIQIIRKEKDSGLQEINLRNHILICSNQMGFIKRILEDVIRY